MNLIKRIATVTVAAAMFTATLPVLTSYAAEKSDGTIFSYDGNSITYGSWGAAGTNYGAIANATAGDGGKAATDVYGTATIQSNDNTNTEKEWRYVVQNSQWTADGKGSNTHLVMTAQIKPTSDITKINFNTNGSAAIAPSSETAIVNAWNVGEWNLITVVYDYSSKVAKTYVNGVDLNSDKSVTLTPGTNRLQFSVYGAEGKTFGIDNVKYYHAMNPQVPAIPTIDDSEKYTVSDGNIYIGGNVKASDITSSGNEIRIFTDDTYATQVSDDDTLTVGMRVVAESTEGMMKYYAVKAGESYDILKVNSSNQTPADWTDNVDWTATDVAGKVGTSAVTVGTVYNGELSSWTKQSGSKFAVMSAQIISEGEITSAEFRAGTSSVTKPVTLLQNKWNSLIVVYDIENQSSQTYLNGVSQGTLACGAALTGSSIALCAEVSTGTIGIDNIHIYQTNVKPYISAPELLTGTDYAVDGKTVKIKQGDDVTADMLLCTSDAQVRLYTSEYESKSGNLANGDIVVVEKDGIFTYYTVSETVPSMITIAETENGTVTTSKQEAFKDEIVTITVTPDTDYEVGSVTVKDESDTSVAVTDNGDGTYSFTMPESDVTVTVVIAAMPEYSITVSDTIRNGIVTVDKETSVKGKSITVTATANVGYRLVNIKANGNEITNGTFIMPDTNVTITAEFEPMLIDNENIVDAPDTLAFNFNNSDEGFSRTGLTLANTEDALKITVTGKDNYITKQFDSPINGSDYYGIAIRMKHENCTNLGAYSTPTMKLMYNGGAGLGMNEGRSATVTLSVTDEDGDGRYDSDGYVTYFIDTSTIQSWSTATDISAIRFDILKGQTDGVGGTVYIDYIKLIQTVSVDAVSGDDGEKSQKVQADADTLDFHFSTPVESESIKLENIKLYNELGSAIKIKEIEYDSTESKLIVTPLENIKAETSYAFEISNIGVNGQSQTVSGVFKTAERVIKVSNPHKSGNTLSFDVANSSSEKEILIVCALYQGDVFKGYKAVKHTAGNGNSVCNVTFESISSGIRIESYVYEYTNGIPKLILNDIYTTN